MVERTKEEILTNINEIVENMIQPNVAMHGGHVSVMDFDSGIVWVELEGSCVGCPSSLMTLKMGIQGLLCHMIPEVQSVEHINGMDMSPGMPFMDMPPDFYDFPDDSDNF